ncbi:uncharacterized protein LOC132060773 [Lycium ferocissimum]|uniref:uncharacterized protein LOC132060773 n=1 Tax=Lycium ferocissimum TaxID=112874 RepID=UPI0028166E8C|nr:uncharacterized protein LOC132060773 [Lycium ferocissimum]
MLSYFELRDFINELGYSTTCTFSIKPPNSGILVDVESDRVILDMSVSLKSGDIVEVFVQHMVEELELGPPLLEYVSLEDREESCSAFNKRVDDIGADEIGSNERVVEEPLNDPITPCSFTSKIAEKTPSPTCTTPAATAEKTPPHSSFTSDFTAADNTLPPTSFTPAATAAENAVCLSSSTPAATENTDGNPPLEDDVGPVGSNSLDEGSDFSTDDSEQSVHEIEGNDEEGYASDDPEEVRELRAERRSVIQRRKRRERAKPDSEEVPAGEAGVDLGFDEIEIGRVSLEGRLGGDEPYYGSSDDDSFEIDEDECWDNEEDIESGGVNVPRKNNAKNKIIHDPTAKKVVWQLGMVFKDVNEFRGAVTKYAVQKRVPVEKFVNEPKRG